MPLLTTSASTSATRSPASEDGRLSVGAEHFLQRDDHLAFGGPGARRGDDRRHQVLLAGGSLLQRRERGLDLGGVATGPCGLQAIELLLLERRVDPKNRELLRLVVLEVV